MVVAVNSIVTKPGMAAAIAAGNSGPQVEIVGFRIGSRSQAEGATADENDTDVDTFVYQGTSDQMSYSVIDEDTVMYRIVLETDIGNFDIGNLGLMMPDGTMFAKAVLPQKTPKWHNNLPALVGNRKIIDVVLVLSNQAAIVNLTILVANECSLPQVPTELQLPNPSTAPYNTYQVQNHTSLGCSCIAFRFNGAWRFSPERLLAGAGQSILAVNQSLFLNTSPVKSIVSLNYDNNTYGPGDPGSETNPPIGLRSALHEITVLGFYEDLTKTWTPGQRLFSGVGADAGKLVTVDNGYYVGFAVTPTIAWVDFTINHSFSDMFTDTFNVYLRSYRYSNIPDTWSTIYEVPSSTPNARWIGFSMNIINKFSSFNDISCRVLKADGTTVVTYAFEMALNEHEQYDLFIKKQVFMAGDKIQLKATIADKLDANMSGVYIEDVNLQRFDKKGLVEAFVTLMTADQGRDYVIQSLLMVNENTSSIPIPVNARRSYLDTGQIHYYIRNHAIPNNSSLEVCDKEAKIRDGQQLQIAAGSAGGLQAIVSVRRK